MIEKLLAPEKQQRPAMLVNGYAYPTISPEVLNAWIPDLSFLLTFSYGMTPEGDLIVLDDREMIETARQGGTEALMVMTPLDARGSFSDVLASQVLENPAAQDRLIEQILENIREKGMAGVDFDFEYIPAENRDDYTAFLTKATMRLNGEGYIVTAAVAPKTSDEQTGLLYEGHDYYGIGQAVNFVLLMTYEWGYTYGPPMAVAPLDQVRRVIEYGVSRIPADKILMGVPNYGYDWTLPFIRGQSRAVLLSHDEAVALASRYQAAIQFDETAQSPYFYYTDTEGNEHVVWFENGRSLRAKLQLAKEFSLAGIGIWNVMSFYEEGSQVLNEEVQIAKL